MLCLVATEGKWVCFSPWRKDSFLLENSITRDQCLARAQQAFSTDLIRFSFFLPWKKEKKSFCTLRLRGTASGNNQHLIVEAYCKSAKNLTAALVGSARPAGWGLHRGEWHQESFLLCAREKHTVRISTKNIWEIKEHSLKQARRRFKVRGRLTSQRSWPLK